MMSFEFLDKMFGGKPSFLLLKRIFTSQKVENLDFRLEKHFTFELKI
eukprot:UN00397